MKRIISLLLAGIMCLSFVACGGNETPKENKNISGDTNYKIGDTTFGLNNNFEVTLKSVEFADAVNMDRTSESFCMPMNKALAISTEDVVTTEESGKTIICYSLEYRFIGTELYKDTFQDLGNICVRFDNDYMFREYYASFRKRTTDNKWYMFSLDTSHFSRNADAFRGLWSSIEYEPFEEKTYLVRGFILVPEKVRTDTTTPLEIIFPKLSDIYSIR